MNKLYKKILEIKVIPRFIKIIIIMGINWTFQSLLYLDRTEKVFKVFLDFIFFISIFLILYYYLSVGVAIFSSIIIAHTINWIINGHVFALCKTFGWTKTDYKTFIDYLNVLKDRSSRENSICLVATFGSLSRKELKQTSDLDIRVVRKTGFVNGVRACIFVIKERSKAFFNRFPLDIYLLDNYDGLNELGEAPVIIYSPSQQIKR